MTTLVLLLIDLVSWCLHRLGLRRAIAFGRALGSFVFHLVRVRRKIVLANLAHAFPEKSERERRTIAKGCYRQLGRLAIEVLLMPRMTPDEIRSLVRFDGVEPIDDVLRGGQGIVFCMGHLGNWELLGYETGRRGYRFVAITKTLKGKLNQRLHDTRKKVFGELPASGSFEAGLDVLARGDVLALIIDQHRASDKAVAVEYFGRRAATSPAPALFSLRSGAPVYAGWMTLDPDDVYTVHFRGPFPVPEAPTLAERLQRHSQMLASDLESIVREHPSEWFWVHRRWKLAEAEARAAAQQGSTTASA